MTPAQVLVVRAYAARVAELWADGDTSNAEKWADAAFRLVDVDGEFIDLEDEADL